MLSRPSRKALIAVPASARRTAVAATCLLLVAGRAHAAGELPALSEFTVRSTLDGTDQPSMLWAPTRAANEATPLFVVLHTWSGDYRQNNDDWLREAAERQWIYLHPNFRGPNTRPQACGSRLARQDVLDAVDHVIAKFRVDESRIYLAGASGGGHMTMLMAAYYPRRFSAASAWVGISDLALWHRFHTKDGKPGRYAQMVEASCGGVPGASRQVDAEYRARSPIFHLQHVGKLPIELSAGVNDGHVGSVPIHHSLWAFNEIAKAGGYVPVSTKEMDELWTNRRLSTPRDSDRRVDSAYDRKIRLRRRAGPARVTIFVGGHEGLPHAAADWLARHRRATRAVSTGE